MTMDAYRLAELATELDPPKAVFAVAAESGEDAESMTFDEETATEFVYALLSQCNGVYDILDAASNAAGFVRRCPGTVAAASAWCWASLRTGIDPGDADFRLRDAILKILERRPQ